MYESFLLILQFRSSIFAAVAACLMFAVYYRKLQSDGKKVAGVVLVYGITEMITGTLGMNNISNLWVYNIMLVPQAVLVSWTLVPGITILKIKKNLIAMMLVLIAAHIVNMIFIQGIQIFASYTFIPVCIGIAAVSYFHLQSTLGDININPLHSLLTWLALASMIDNAAAMPIITLLGWEDVIQNTNIELLYSIVTWLYTFWYLTLITGLIWTTAQHRSYTQSE